MVSSSIEVAAPAGTNTTIFINGQCLLHLPLLFCCDIRAGRGTIFYISARNIKPDSLQKLGLFCEEENYFDNSSIQPGTSSHKELPTLFEALWDREGGLQTSLLRKTERDTYADASNKNTFPVTSPNSQAHLWSMCSRNNTYHKEHGHEGKNSSSFPSHASNIFDQASFSQLFSGEHFHFPILTEGSEEARCSVPHFSHRNWNILEDKNIMVKP